MMSQSQSQADSIPPVREFHVESASQPNLSKYQILQASVHDVRFFAGMLRGVSFANVRLEPKYMR